MGADFLGVDIAGIIDDTFADLGIEGAPTAIASWTELTPGTRTPGAEASGTNPTPTVHTKIRGFIASYSLFYIDGTNVFAGDRRAIIFGDSLPKDSNGRPLEPKQNDKITDIDGKTYRIVILSKRDPAKAVYDFQVR